MSFYKTGTSPIIAIQEPVVEPKEVIIEEKKEEDVENS